MLNVENKNYPLNWYWMITLLGLLISLFLLRVLGRAGFMLLLIFGLATLLLAGWSIIRYLARRRANPSPASDGSIEQKRQFCRVQIANLQTEITSIDVEIDRLQREINQDSPVAITHREMNDLLSGFRKERELRRSKIEFYELALQKLDALARHQRLRLQLDQQRSRLRQLRERNYEQLSNAESLQRNIDVETRYLETIETLSLKVLESKEIDATDELHLELRELTRLLDRPPKK